MIFASPSWLWVLPAVIAVYLWFCFDFRSRRKQFARFAGESLWKQIVPEADWSARPRKALLWSLAAVFLVIALARPQWGSHEEVVKVTGLDIMVAFDVSNSMDVEDVVPSRLKKAQHVVRSIASRLSGDRMGIVAFAASTYLACPLTTDLGYVTEILQTLGPKSVASQGTDIGLALETVARALERGAEQEGDKDGTRVVVLVTDGEDLEGKALEGARMLAATGAKLYVLGVGTEKGGPIPIRDDSGVLVGYKKDSSNQPIVSKMSPETLSQIASAAGGKFWTVTSDERELDELFDEIGSMNRTDRLEKRRIIHEERFQIPLGLALLLLLWELSVPLRKRAGTVAGLLILAAALLPSSARADSIEVYQDTQKGLKAFSQGKMDEARENFGRAQALDPERPELLFNQGVIEMDQKDPDKALQGFGGAAQGAEKRGDPGLAARSFYNLGGTLSTKGDTPGAIASYLSAIDAAKKAKDPALEDAARKQIELAMKKQEQQKQQQKQGQPDQKKDQNDKNQQDQKNDQQKNQDQPGNSNPSQPPQQQPDQGSAPRQEEQNPKPQFSSQKLSKEDAERVMDQLAEREKELQGKLRRQKGQPQTTDRDW